MRPEPRHFVMVMLLCAVTCGIYFFYWQYQVSREIQDYTGESNVSPGMEVFFTIITCGIYGWFWFYRYNQMLQRTIGHLPVFGGDNTVVCVVLSVLELSWVAAGIMQNQLNTIWENLDRSNY